LERNAGGATPIGARKEGMFSGKNDSQAAGRGCATRWADDDLHITAKASQTIEQLGFADAPELAAQNLGELGLRDAQYVGGLLLAPTTRLDDLVDLADELRFYQHFVGVGKTQVGIDIAGTFFNLDGGYVHDRFSLL
jgi:hypothetical protein